MPGDLDRQLRLPDGPRARGSLLTEVHRYLQGGTKLQRVIVVLYDEEACKVFARELRRGFR